MGMVDRDEKGCTKMGFENEVAKSIEVWHRGVMVKDCGFAIAWRVVLAKGSTGHDVYEDLYFKRFYSLRKGHGNFSLIDGFRTGYCRADSQNVDGLRGID